MRLYPILLLLFLEVSVQGQVDSVAFYSLQGQYDKIIRYLSDKPDISQQEKQVLAMAWAKNSHLGKAIEVVKTHIEEDGFTTGAGLLLGDLTYRAGYLDQSLNAYSKVFMTDSTEKRAYLPLAGLLLTFDKNIKAIEVLKYGLEKDSTNIAMLMKLSDAYLKVNRFRNSDEVLRRAFKLDPENLSIHRDLVKVNFKIKEYAYVHSLCKKGVESYPDLYFFYYYDGLSFYRESDFESAYNLLIQANELNSFNSNITKYLGISGFKTERYSEAVKHLKYSIRDNEDAADVNFYLGCALSYLGDNVLALPYLQKAQDILTPEPRVMAEIHLQKGISNRALKLYDNAERDFSTALKSDSTQAVLALFYQASMYEFDLDRKKEAKQLYLEFISYIDRHNLTLTEGDNTYRGVADRRITAITEELFFIEGSGHE